MADGWYREWAVRPALRPFVVCSWASWSGDRGPDRSDPILPDGCVDIVWNGVEAFVAGPDTGPVAKPWVPGSGVVGIRFRPGAGATVLGMPTSELRDQRVALDAAWRHGAAEVIERLSVAAASTGWPGATSSSGPQAPIAAAGALEALVHGRCRVIADPDALVQAAIGEMLARPARRVGLLPDRLGVTERTLRRRVTAAVGYGPKVLARVVRFRRFVAAAHTRPGAGLARLAIDVGYADQAHLSRECRELAGATPTELLGTRGVRSVQDGLVTDDAHWHEAPENGRGSATLMEVTR